MREQYARELKESKDDEIMLLIVSAMVLAFFVGLGFWLVRHDILDYLRSPPITEQIGPPVVTQPVAEPVAAVEPRREPRERSTTPVQPQPVQAAVAAPAAQEIFVPEVVQEVIPEPVAAEPEPMMSAPEIFEPVEPEIEPAIEPEPVQIQETVAEPAPVAEPEPREATQAMVATIDEATENVTFIVASTTLTDESKSILDKVAAVMVANPERRLGIIGHTDSQGEADKNVRLSFARAQACADYLASKDVPANQMEVAGMGEQMPISSNLTADGRKQNRRVEFQLLEG